MPIPEKITRAEWDAIENDEFLERATIELKWSWWPRRCALTNEWLCFDLAYKATRVWTGPGEPVIEQRWYDRYEFLFFRLKGKQHV